MFSMTAEGEGAQKYKKDQRRRAVMVIASVLLAVLAIGAVISGVEIARGGGDLSPTLAILLALLFVGGFIISNWLYLRNVDELEWANNFSAGFWSLLTLTALYPTWLVLWSGKLVPEPSAEGLYLITLGSAGAFYLWRRFRQHLF
jgi:hypothetical protein